MIRVLGFYLLLASIVGLAQSPQLSATLNPQIPGASNLWRLQWQSSIMSDTAVIQIFRTRPTGGTELLITNIFDVQPNDFQRSEFFLESTEQVYTVILSEYKNGPTGFLEGRAIFENVVHYVEPDCPECVCPELYSPVIDFAEDDLNITVRVLNLTEIQALANGQSLTFKLVVVGPLSSARVFQSNTGNFSFEATDGDGIYECTMTYEIDGDKSFASTFNVTAHERDKRVVILRVSGVGLFESLVTINRLPQQTRLRLTLHSDLGFSASVNYDLFSYNQFDERAVAINVSTIFGDLAGPLEIQEEASTSYRKYGIHRIIARSYIYNREPNLTTKQQQLIDFFTPSGTYLSDHKIAIPDLPENVGWIEYMDLKGLDYVVVDATAPANDLRSQVFLSKQDMMQMETQPATVIWSTGLFMDEFNPERGVHARIQDHENPFDGEWLIALNMANADGRFDLRFNNRSVDSVTLLPRQSSLIHLTTRDDGLDRPGFFQVITAPTALAKVELRAITNPAQYVYGIITVSNGTLAIQPY